MRGLAGILACCMAVPMVPAGRAQESAPRLNLVIVEGDGAINNIHQRTARDFIVQVQDENHKPVAGASVIFLLPSQGAGGEFANGSQTLAVTSDSQGNAIARGFRPNNVQGQFQIHVNASFNGQTGSTNIHMGNATVGGVATATVAGLSVKLFVVLVAVGAAAAAGGAYYATHSGGSGSSTAASVVTLIPGTATVGAPGQ